MRGHGRHNLKSQKGAILRFIASSPTEEVNVFLDIVFKPFSTDLSLAVPNPATVVPLQKQVGFLGLVMDLIQHMGVHFPVCIPLFFIKVVCCRSSLRN